MWSISLGFGKLLAGKERRPNNEYREWEFGAYSGEWKILRDTKLILSKDRGFKPAELNLTLQSIAFGRFSSLVQLSESAVQLNLDNGVAVQFFGDITDEDEYFHVFCPGDQYVELSRSGWSIGRSDLPWKSG